MNRNKILKSLNIKQLKKCPVSRQYCEDVLGYIPRGLACPWDRTIWLKKNCADWIFIHEIIHVLMNHSNAREEFDHAFMLQELECETTTLEICKKLNIYFDQYGFKWCKRLAKRKKYDIKLRLNRMNQAKQQFLEAYKK